MTLFTSRKEVDDFMEATVFQCKEKLDKNEKQLVRGYKHPITGKLVPVIKYFWTIKDWDDYPSLKINIQCPDREAYRKIRMVQETLNELGITFNTSYGGSRGWDFGASLEGYHFVRKNQTKDFKYILREKQFNVMKIFPPLELVHDVCVNKCGRK